MVILKKSSLADEVCVGHIRNKNGYDDIHAFISSSNHEHIFQGKIFYRYFYLINHVKTVHVKTLDYIPVGLQGRPYLLLGIRGPGRTRVQRFRASLDRTRNEPT